MELKHLTRDAVRELLTIMCEAWLLRSMALGNANVSTLTPEKEELYLNEEVAAYVDAAGGDPMLGELAYLFSYWSNDVATMAAYYGVGFLADGTLFTDLPPPPTPEHWWSEGEWQPPFDLQDEGVEH